VNPQRENPAQILARAETAPRTDRHVAIGVLSVVLFAGLTFVGTHIRIPLYPVPITLQTLFVLLSGAVLGRRLGSLSQSVYLGLGAIGAPIFAGSLAGLGVLAGPTGGYLIGFAVAPLFVGSLIGRRTEAWWSAAVFSIGTLIILALGVLHLTLFYTHSLADSLRVGCLPFLPGDMLKVVAAVSIYRSYRGIRRAFSSR
jgi:biotin transport system substrate-specific component